LQDYIRKLKKLTPQVHAFAKKSHARYEVRMEQTQRNQSRKLRTFQRGSLVKLYKKPLHKKHAKLSSTWQGPYIIVRMSEDGANADIKHVGEGTVLKQQMINSIRMYVDRPNSAVPERERKKAAYTGKSWVVEKVVDDKGTHGVDKHFKIRWEGDFQDTWEPEDNLNCPKLVQAYMRSKARKPAQAGAYYAGDTASPWAMTIPLNLLALDASDMTASICRQAGISMGCIAGKFGFVPCETYSVADMSNITRGFHHRDHTIPSKPPRRDAGDKRDKALAHDLLISNILTSWMCDAEAGYDHAMLLENPVGSLQHRPFMRWLPTALGLTQRRVDFCAYGHPFKKPTHIWCNLKWKPKGNTGDGRCGTVCGQGRVQESTGKYKHYRGLAQEPIRGPRGPGANKLLNSIPDKLTQEWMDSMVKRRIDQPDQNTIIDLCAGYQSIKQWALDNGFNYIAVDIMGDRNIRRRQAAKSSTVQP